MKSAAVAGILIVGILIGAGLGYFAGNSGNSGTTTSTITSTRQGPTIVQTQYATSTLTLTATSTTMVAIPSNGGLGNWTETKNFPLYVADTSCATNDGFAYCVGGYNGTTPENGHGFLDTTYFASLSSTGTGGWTMTTEYPIGIQDETCVTALGYLYCVGGVSNTSSDPYKRVADVYFAQASSSGIAGWQKTTSFPYVASDPRCVASESTIICIEASFNGSLYSPPARSFYSTLSPTGVGNWTQTTGPPTLTAGCSSAGGYIYCFGGGSCPPFPGDCPSPSYYARITANGVGNWSSTTELPTAAFAAFTTGVSFQYYFANQTYVAPLSHYGIGTWGKTPPYPEGFPQSCFAYGFYVYCVGGWNSQTGSYTNRSYLAKITFGSGSEG